MTELLSPHNTWRMPLAASRMAASAATAAGAAAQALQPMHDWLSAVFFPRSTLELAVGAPTFGLYSLAAAWLGLLLDLGGPLLLLLGSPRVAAAAAAVLALFHLFTHVLFVLEVFPWVMLTALLLFAPQSSLEWTATCAQSAVGVWRTCKRQLRIGYALWISRHALLVVLLFVHGMWPLLCGIQVCAMPLSVYCRLDNCEVDLSPASHLE
jgi:hypothetical protein